METTTESEVPMDAIKAMVKNGRIEPESPLDLPDGTPVLIVRANADAGIDVNGDPDGDIDGQWDDSPEGIEAWLKAYAELKPLIFTPEERAALEKDRAERKAWELAHFDEYSEKLRKLWE